LASGKTPRESAALSPSIDGPLAVIGDLHGQKAPLAALIGKLQRRRDFQERWIVFCGDFLDRGEDPRGALELVLELAATHERTTAVMGNHDLALAGALGLVPAPAEADWPRRYLHYYDSDRTFQSYGVPPGDLAALATAMPKSHLDFIAGLPWAVEHPDYLVVHAGLLPEIPYRTQLEALRRRDFSEGRPPWLFARNLSTQANPPDCPVIVISGHIAHHAVVINRHKILVDVSGGYLRRLNAVLLPEGDILSARG